MSQNLETAYFAAGCFWGVEAHFKRMTGVQGTKVGYMGGFTKNPSYADVCTDSTGHAETVKVTFDSQTLTFPELLRSFWQCHDPRSLNRQGMDAGSQYRSAIFYVNHEQRQQAITSKEQHEASHPDKGPIVTEITPAGAFYEAETYHQNYYEKTAGSCGLSGSH